MSDSPSSTSSNLSPEEVRAQAEQFMQLLTQLRVDNTPESNAMRDTLVGIVTEFRDTENREQAKVELLAKLMGVESGMADIMARNISKLRDTLGKQSKRIGASSVQGKTIRATTDALTTLLDALQRLVDANAENDPALRQSAHALLAQARSKLEAVGMR
ncbi:MAG: hypothetical protein H7Z43_08985 [Clostridia bacterium]|nr:hypothetical protein [Deltaproteobacteria bacterium]